MAALKNLAQDFDINYSWFLILKKKRRINGYSEVDFIWWKPQATR